MSAEEIVWQINDLRKEIFSWLRKEPKFRCTNCYAVVIWDKKVKEFINVTGGDYSQYGPTIYCVDCWGTMLPGPPCSVS